MIQQDVFPPHGGAEAKFETPDLKAHNVKFCAQKHGNENALALDSFILTHGIKTIEDNKVVNCHETANVYVVLCLKGGAPTGVIKTIIKSKTSDKTSHADMPKFQNAFLHASALVNSNTENITGIFKKSSCGDLGEDEGLLGA